MHKIIADYLRVYKGRVRPGTYQTRMYILVRCPFKTPGEAARGLEHYISQSYGSPCTRSNALYAYRDLFRHMAAAGLCTAVELAAVLDIPRWKRGNLKKTPYTPAELRRVLAEVEPPDRVPFFRLLYAGGLRLGECRALKVPDLHHAPGRVHISRTITDTRVGPPKTFTSVRMVTVPRWVLDEALACYHENPNAWLWWRWGSLLSLKTIRRTWAKAQDRAGVKYRPPGVLRHTWASHMLMEGAGAPAVAAQLGHTGIKTLSRYYSSWIETDGGSGLRGKTSKSLQARSRGDNLKVAHLRVVK